MTNAKTFVDYANQLKAEKAAEQAAAAQAATATTTSGSSGTYVNTDTGGDNGGVDYSVGSVVGYNGWYYYDS